MTISIYHAVNRPPVAKDSVYEYDCYCDID